MNVLSLSHSSSDSGNGVSVIPLLIFIDFFIVLGLDNTAIDIKMETKVHSV